MNETFDVIQRTLAKLREQLPDGVRDSEMVTRLEFLLLEMRDANERAGGVIEDQRVKRAAGKLDRARLDRPQYIIRF